MHLERARLPLPLLLLLATFALFQPQPTATEHTQTPWPPQNSCAVFNFTGWGFASQINTLLLAIGGLPHQTWFVDESQVDYKCSAEGSWGELFSSEVQALPAGPDTPTCDVYSLFDTLRMVPSLHSNRTDLGELVGQAVQKLWRLSPELSQRTNQQRSFLASLPQPLMAVHVRGGDKKAEEVAANPKEAKRRSYKPEHFAKAMVALVQQHQQQNTSRGEGGLVRQHSRHHEAVNGTCVIYGDELRAKYEAAKALRAKLGCYLVLLGGSTEGHNQQEFFRSSRAEKCKATKQFLTELHNMALADLFVGSFNSNIARLVQALRIWLLGKQAWTGRDVYDKQWSATP